MKKGFDQEKALQALIYIASHAPQPDFFHISKLFYFAEKEHLGKYGRFICGDDYCALEHGPVPTRIYDLLKKLDGRGDSHFLDSSTDLVAEVERTCVVEQGLVAPRVDANLDFFSESDLECLNSAIEKYGKLSFAELKNLSHDAAWKATQRNQTMSLESIVATLPDGKALYEYIKQA